MSAKSKLKPFRHALKDERIRTGITQKRAAEILAMSVRTYEDWEAGYSTPAIAHQEGVLARLAATPTAK
jgi:transcriptional regulator with XRE-family HTH domain